MSQGAGFLRDFDESLTSGGRPDRRPLGHECVSPFINPGTKKAYTRTRAELGTRVGRRDAAVRGTSVPFSSSHAKLASRRKRRPDYAALRGGNDANSVAALRTVNESIIRETPLMIKLTPTRVPIAQAELEGHCR
jgi:hypothetical protein